MVLYFSHSEKGIRNYRCFLSLTNKTRKYIALVTPFVVVRKNKGVTFSSVIWNVSQAENWPKLDAPQSHIHPVEQTSDGDLLDFMTLIAELLNLKCAAEHHVY